MMVRGVVTRILRKSMSTMRKQLVIDTDAGVDDAQAILMALTNKDVDVLGVTCVAGNADSHQVGLNVLRILHVANRLDIPVYVGCNEPLLGEKLPRSDYHGSDGFGDSSDPEAPDSSHLKNDHAVTALIKLSKEHEGNLSLVCIGPLTNIAMAIRMDPAIGSRLKECFVMGGNHEGKGNMTTSAEFNFYYDPEAAYVVLNQLQSPITIVTWEVCEKHSLPWDIYHKMRSTNTKIGNFLKKIEKFSAEYTQVRRKEKFETADELLMTCLLCSDVVEKSCQVYATVEVKGHYTRGQMVVDWKSVLNRTANVKIITEINQKNYESQLLKLSTSVLN